VLLVGQPRERILNVDRKAVAHCTAESFLKTGDSATKLDEKYEGKRLKKISRRNQVRGLCNPEEHFPCCPDIYPGMSSMKCARVSSAGLGESKQERIPFADTERKIDSVSEVG